MVIRDVGSRIEGRIRRAGGHCSGWEKQKYSDYIGLLTKWNKQISLTSLKIEPLSEEAIDRLIVEPALAAKFIVQSDALLVDVGSGGGSPAIPMRIAAPWPRLVMVEVKTRKSAFLREAVRVLGFDRVEVCNSALQELLTRPDLHEAADVVTVRAVRADRRLWSAIVGLLKPSGRIFWFGSAGGPEVGSALLPSLLVESRTPLLPHLGSYLTTIRRAG